MMNLVLLPLLFPLLNVVYSFAPNTAHDLSFFRHWTCLGIRKHIDFSKPYPIHIGELPLVLWKNHNTGKILSTLNICKHMGSKLDNGVITDTGCLKCKYHGLEFSEADCFGEITEHEGKIFWAYDPKDKTPYKTPFYHNPNYIKSYLEVDIEASLTDSAFNTIDIRHPEYVHSIGFGSNIPASNIKQYLYKDTASGMANRVGLYFEYQSNRWMRTLNDNTQSTQNFHMFVYPTFTWSRVSFENKHLIISVNFLPLDNKKTRWFVTICHNYFQSNLQRNFIKMLATTIVGQDYIQMQNQYKENALKKAVMFDYTFKDEEAILWLNDIFKNYQIPDVDVCTELYKVHRERHSNSNKKLEVSMSEPTKYCDEHDCYDNTLYENNCSPCSIEF